MSFWKWLFKISPDKASDPNPSPMPVQDTNSTPYNQSRPIETLVEKDTVLGTVLNLGYQNAVGRDANGQLIRVRERINILCGCGHIVSQLHAENEHGKHPKRGIEGKCYYCTKELQDMLKKGEITEIEAERLSFVCSDCARMVSGILCCPKHCVELTDNSGRTTYISIDEHENQKRKELTDKILAPFAYFFTEPAQTQLKLPQPKDTNDEQED